MRELGRLRHNTALLDAISQNDAYCAYARGEHWDERVKMMAWWADYLDRLKSVGAAVQIERKSA